MAQDKVEKYVEEKKSNANDWKEPNTFQAMENTDTHMNS